MEMMYDYIYLRRVHCSKSCVFVVPSSSTLIYLCDERFRLQYTVCASERMLIVPDLLAEIPLNKRSNSVMLKIDKKLSFHFDKQRLDQVSRWLFKSLHYLLQGNKGILW